MNQLGGWPRLETGWVSATALRFEFSVLCHLPLVHTGRESRSMESEPAGAAGAAPKAAGRANVAGRDRRSPQWKRKQTGDCTRFEPGRATALRVRIAPLPLATAQPVEGAALIRR